MNACIAENNKAPQLYAGHLKFHLQFGAMQFFEFAAALLVFTFLGTLRCAPCGEQGFYNIAHMCNTPKSVDWALAQGANGVEMDLQFDARGHPSHFQHKAPCDCICYCLIPGTCKYVAPYSICAAIENETGGDPCNAQTDVVTLIEYVTTKSDIAVIHIDGKVTDFNDTMQAIAGINVANLLLVHLFRKNYTGIVIINSYQFSTLTYLTSAVAAFNLMPFKDRVFFTIDGEETRLVESFQHLISMPTKNIIYGTGSSACLPNINIPPATYRLAAYNQAAKVVGLSFVWTVDMEFAIQFAFNYFGGIITNFPIRVKTLANQANIALATPCSAIPQAENTTIVTDKCEYSCECNVNLKGCKISKAAPRNAACFCTYLILACSGEVVKCRNPNSQKCASPDDTVESCQLAGGNCLGY